MAWHFQENISIAIVGIAFRFPSDVHDETGLWDMLKNGRCGITRIPDERWPVDELLHVSRAEPGRSVSFSAGILSGINQFDAAFFGISPREAAWLDPQQRLLLELAYESMEDAGICPSSLAGSRCGVYAGVASLDYGQHALEDMASISAYSMTGNTLSIVANRVSYFFDLRGPSLAIDTACSSSLVALHHACQALRSGEIPVALVGGVSLLMHPYSFIGFSKASMLSAKGHCRPFDAAADGYVRAEGGACLILKPLRQAKEDGDQVHAIILSSGTNADGARKSGLTIPSVFAQTELMRQVLAKSGLGPDDMDFIEAHGTGTPVGDPIEADSIGRAYGQGRKHPIPISSVKGNLGHLEAASGMAGLVKAVLALKKGELPPMPLDFTPNPQIDFSGLRVQCPTNGMPLYLNDRAWLAAGVNSFGFGGVNAHVVMRSADAPRQTENHSGTAVPLLLSARSEEALRDLAGAYAALLEGADHAHYYDVAYCAAFHRGRLEKRLAIFEEDPTAVGLLLKSFANGETPHGVLLENVLPEKGGIAFVYSGNNSQWVGMGRGLHASSAVFAEIMATLDNEMRPLLGRSLVTALLEDDPDALADTTISQPLLFAVQVGVTILLRDMGITPQAVTGHSVGEIAAAWAAGALSLKQAVQVIHARSHAQGTTRGAGRMAVVGFSATEAEDLIRQADLAGRLEIAGINSPCNVTLSGDLAALLWIEEHTRPQNIFFHLLNLDYAFHSRHMDDIREMLAQNLKGLTPSSNTSTVFVSTVTGQTLEGKSLNIEYWWKNVRQPVLFSAAVEHLASLGCRIFVEIGPNAILLRYLRENLATAGAKGRILPTLLRDDDDMIRIRKLAARLHALTDETDLRAFFPQVGRRIPLPRYPWQRTRCWYPRTSECPPDKRRIHPLLGWPLDSVELTWENILDPIKDSWLNDHKVGGAIVFPGAGYVEMALAAAHNWQSEAHVALESLDIAMPLVFENGRSQCVRCILHPGDGSFRIVSRPRLGTGEWVRHATGRIVAAAGREPDIPMDALDDGYREMDGETLYSNLTDQLGLDYGASFRVIECIRMDACRLDASLRPVDVAGYVLPPAALDACFHALAALYAAQAHMPQMAFLPVKMGRVDRYVEGVVRYVRAHVRHRGRRSMTADFELLNAEEHLVARARDCRFRAAPTLRNNRDHVLAWSVRPWLTPHPDLCETANIPRFETLVHCMAAANAADAPQRGIWFRRILPLMEAVVLSSALRTLHCMAADDPRWHENLSSPYFRWLVWLLREEGLLADQDGQWILASTDELPPAEDLWREAFSQWPQCLPALLPVGRVSRRLPEVLRGQIDTKTFQDEICSAPVARDNLQANPFRQGIDTALQAAILHLARHWPAHRRLRILEVTAVPTGMTETLDAQLPPDRFEHVLAMWDAEALSQARLHYGKHPAVKPLHFDVAQWLWEGEPDLARQFDVIVLRHSLHKASHLVSALTRLRGLLAPGGLLLAAERHPDWSTDFVEGLDPAWWHEGSDVPDGRPISSLLRPADWISIFEEQGFAPCLTYTESAAEGLDEGAYLLLAGHAPETAEPAIDIPPASWLLLIDETSRPLADALCDRLEVYGQKVTCAYDESPPATDADHVLFLRGAEDTPQSVTSTLDALLRSARQNAALDSAPKLWIVTRGGALGTELPEGYVPRPAQCAVAGLGRVIMSEYDNLNCVLLDVPEPECCPDLACRLEKELLEPDGTNEILLTPQARYALKLEGEASSGPATPMAPDERYRLDFTMPGRLGNLAWQADTAGPLDDNEVEVRVKATGLNFRDVMLVMGLVPDDAVENGFAGATLGLEFAGRVTRVGTGVEGLRVGDRVTGFAPSCFASHVVTPAHALARTPDEWSDEAAAAIPTVFFTAWYALKHLARIQPGERVLIHGAAGGVGLAAIQIARHLGAEIFATAGSEEKRDLLRLLGVEHVFDSRGLSFDHDVLAATDGQGVDVALNSLAGEAMRRSVGLLRPFGRFLELGKADFVENTSLGLRPFKENISYFAIDTDQLLTARPALAATLFQEVMELLCDGRLAPVPHRIFPATRAAAAFRVMQQAQHIGKIVVASADAPPLSATGQPAPPLELDGESTWLVTGGLSGFGLVTARHLAERGAKHLVLAGRRGAATPEAEQVIKEFKKLGVNAYAEACDVADAEAVHSLVAHITETMPPLKGVVHVAGIFDDRFLANMDARSLETVLAPKLSGAWHLHEATLGLPLTHFVVYSSVSVSVGNPGQGNYVAANAGLEGLARLRLHMGLPAVCIAWGPVGNAGYLARNEAVRKSLAQHLGRPPFTSVEAMRHLDNALATGGIHILADVDWGVVGNMLPGKASRFEFVSRHAAQGIGTDVTCSVQDALAGKSSEEVMAILRGLIIEEVAQVLAIGTEQISPGRSLQSMGLDSLMAVELAVGLEQRMGVRLPAMMFQDSPTVEQVAGRIAARLAGITRDEADDDSMLTELARRHAEELDTGETTDILHNAIEGDRV